MREISGPELPRRDFLRVAAVVGLSVAVIAMSACGGSDSVKNDISPTPETEAPVGIELQQLGQSLIAMQEDHEGGWRFKSEIQSPHYQTDRDVGVSGVGMGFLVLADQFTNDPRWTQAAEKTATWLMAVAQKDNDGHVFWADYADDNGRSDSHYTSFDDGTLGVGDFLWRLYERTGNETYRQAAESSLAWTFARAENLGSTEQPIYRWPWDAQDKSSGYQMGMGMGAVGMVHTFADYYQRFEQSNPELAAQCRQYIDGTVRYIGKVRATLGDNDGDSRALPETGVIGQDGDTNMNSGYLSGSAGAAFMYLKLYKTFGDESYLKEAEKMFSWLEDEQAGPMVRFDGEKVAWKLAKDPQGGDDDQLATGFEEGAAGIGWVYLQAYKLTGDRHYLEVASYAANWLEAVADYQSSGVIWHEDESPRNPITHVNLNNGAAGIGMFLKDLYDTTGDNRYKQLAIKARAFIEATAKQDEQVIFWDDNDGKAEYSRDPSWHWGTAGVIAFLARMDGGKVNMPGQQTGL